MNSSTIERALRCESSTKDLFVGVFSADQLPQEKEFPGRYVANADASGQSVEHWIAFFCEKGDIECFDVKAKTTHLYKTEATSLPGTVWRMPSNRDTHMVLTGPRRENTCFAG